MMKRFLIPFQPYPCGATFSFLILQFCVTSAVVWFFLPSSSVTVLKEHKDSRLLLSVEHMGKTGLRTGNQRLRTVRRSRTGYENHHLSQFEGNFDKWRKFKTHMFVFKASSWEGLSKSRQVCLGAQTSLDRLYWLIKTIDVWSGPISIALFSPGFEYFYAAIFINHYLYRCHERVRDIVAFHITYNAEHPTVVTPDSVDAYKIVDLVKKYSCSSDPKILVNTLMQKRSKEMLAWRETMAYPQNLLRNVAKAGCQTNFTFIPDIDMIPIPGMDIALDKFLSEPEQQKCAKCAYVVPTYEIKTSSDHLPVNKTELIQFIEKKEARQFHEALYSINQKSSDLKRWQKIPQSDKLAVAYGVENYIFKYEPLYVSRGDVPQFDERFIGFGMTRNTQFYEMYVAGYKFLVLNNPFTNHWGFQNIKDRPDWRAHQQEQNNHKFDEFAQEVSARYGRDPYGMIQKLKKLGLKHLKVVYGKRN